jgi:hypothetical protein
MLGEYILRIYRRDPERPEMILGLLHDVKKDVHRPFHGLEELCEILSLPDSFCRRKKKVRVTQCRRGKDCNNGGKGKTFCEARMEHHIF